MTMAQFHIRKADWNSERALLAGIREQVFICEQGVPEELEWDGHDEEALHLVAENAAGEPIGTARMLPNGHIGRMAVLPGWRRRGVGSALLQELLRVAGKRTGTTPFLNAQTRSVAFYRRHGFVTEGEEFLDAGILHRHMILAPTERSS